MSSMPSPVRAVPSRRAGVILTRSRTPAAFLGRLFDRLSDAVAAWRRREHEARHVAHLDAVALNDTGLSRSTLLAMGANPRAWGQEERQRFPF